VKTQTAGKKKHFSGSVFSPFWVEPVFPVAAELNVGVSAWQIKKQGSLGRNEIARPKEREECCKNIERKAPGFVVFLFVKYVNISASIYIYIYIYICVCVSKWDNYLEKC